MVAHIKDMHPELQDAVLDALNAAYSALDRHGIERPDPVPGEPFTVYLERIARAFREELEGINQDN